MTISPGIKSWSILVGIALAAACSDDDDDFFDDDVDDGDTIRPEAYRRIDLATTSTDPALVNSWGIAPTSLGFYLANEGTGLVTHYDRNGQVVAGPTGVPLDLGEGITGIIVNPSGDFPITRGGITQPATLIAAREDGNLVASIDAARGAVIVATTPGAVYKGLTFALSRGAPQLYAANFAAGTIDVFDRRFVPVPVPAGGRFVDPNLPRGYSPFNVQALADGGIYVMYALLGEDNEEQVGPGLGVVNKFNAEGQLIGRVATGGLLDAPWGVAIAPIGFGPLGNTILVGNFGDGRITGYASDGRVVGQMEEPDGRPLVIDGLWGMVFGTDGSSEVLYFAAGPNEETTGLYGRIQITTAN